MSHILFQDGLGRAELRGQERAAMSHFVSGFAWTVMGFDGSFPDAEAPALKLLFWGVDYVREQTNPAKLVRDARLAHNVCWEHKYLGKYEMFTAQLNTAARLGGDLFALMARLHGQCEMHAWVDGPDRAWLADLIDRGLTERVFRTSLGWEDVIALLRARDDQPVVTSYSVSESFPYALLSSADLGDDPSWEERYAAGVEALRADDRDHKHSRRLNPAHWTSYHFGHGYTTLQLAAEARLRSQDPA